MFCFRFGLLMKGICQLQSKLCHLLNHLMPAHHKVTFVKCPSRPIQTCKLLFSITDDLLSLP